MPIFELPPAAAWRHVDAREGFEVVFARPEPAGPAFDGSTSAVEEGEPWFVGYEIALAPDWSTRMARVRSRSACGARELCLQFDGSGGWLIDDAPAPHLAGCRDIDLESSSLTNAFPVQRLSLEVGEAAQAPAAYVRALDLEVQRLEQSYVRLPDGAAGERYHYTSPQFEFECELAYDRCGLVIAYPGIAMRVR
jgi:uncharacterized protein